MASSEASPPAPYSPFPTFAEFTRQLAFDPRTFEPFADNFKTLTSSPSVGPDVLTAAVDRATRWAAVNTGAIEGLYEVDRGVTYTVAASAAALDNIHLEHNQAMENHIKDALAGYEYVLDVATGNAEVSEKWIKELHSTICASQETYRVWTEVGWQDQPLPKGEYKSMPNNPTRLTTGLAHSYASPDDSATEIARLVDELRSTSLKAAHPVVQAAYAHYAFVCIHPFADGNGRVSRAIASTYLYRSPGIPLVIFA